MPRTLSLSRPDAVWYIPDGATLAAAAAAVERFKQEVITALSRLPL